MGFELDPCWVHGEGGELIAAGHVRVHEEDRLVVEAPNYSGGSVWPGDAVVLVVASELRGNCTVDATVVASAPTRLEVTDLEIREVVQKRSAVRVPVDARIMIAFQFENGESVKLPEPLPIQVLDLSAYGMRFRADTAVPLGTMLEGVYPGSRRTIPFLVEILRHDELPRGGVGHGGRFVDMAERDTDELFHEVLERQRKIIAERRAAL